MSGNVPFGGRGRPINPRFSLSNEPEGVETEEFSPKRNVGNVGERPRRAVPKPLDEGVSSGPILFPSAGGGRQVSPNSLFGGADDEELSLDIGVNETDTSNVSAVPVRDVPRAVVEPVTPTVPSPSPVVKRNSFMEDSDDLSLDIGVNETDDAPSVNDGKGVDVPAVSARVESKSAPVIPSVVPSPVKGKSSFMEDSDDLSLDIGVNETDDAPSVPVAEVAPSPVVPVRVQGSEPVSRKPVMPAPVNDPTPAPSSVPPVAKSVPRRVNPLFADPSPEVEEELSLDIGVNETDDVPVAKPVKRQISPLFDFKSDGVPAVRRGPDARAVRPEAMMDTGGEEDFEEKKSSKKPSKKAESNRRPFQIQERDVTLLRFLTKYQFSYVDAIARVLDSTPQSINKRLRTLEEYDLVKRQNIAAGSTLWQARKAGIELSGLTFKENKRSISFATIRHTIGLVNLAAELEREAPGAKDILGLGDKFGEPFPVKNRFPGGIRLYGEEALDVPLVYGEMTVSEREIRQGQKRYRGGRSSAEMRDLVDLAILNPDAPELEPGNEGLFVVYGHGGKTGEHVPDLVVTRPRGEDGKPQHFAIELELTPKSPSDWKRILRSYRENGGMYSRIYYFTSDRPIANMIRNADEEVGLGERLVLRKYTPKNKRQPFLG